VNSESVRLMLRTACSDVGGRKYFAAKVGVSQQYICDVLLGRKEPGKKILQALGLERVVTYRLVEGN
jgi:hypothetical protein